MIAVSIPQAVEPAPLTWYAACTAVSRERYAEGNLRDAGFDVYLPMATRWVVHAKKREKVQRPLFPRYVFVGMPDPLMWGAADNARGVERLVRGAGPAPSIVSWRTIDNLRAAEALGQFDDTVKREAIAPFKPGQPVRVIAGPMKGFVAEVAKANPKGRVHLLLGMLGGKVAATVDADQLEAV